jgi:hypothetical protein
LQTNSAEDMQDVPLADDMEGSKNNESDQSGESDLSEDREMSENPEPKELDEAEDWSRVKLASKHAAFIRKTHKKQWFIHYATQN